MDLRVIGAASRTYLGCHVALTEHSLALVYRDGQARHVAEMDPSVLDQCRISAIRVAEYHYVHALKRGDVGYFKFKVAYGNRGHDIVAAARAGCVRVLR